MSTSQEARTKKVIAQLLRMHEQSQGRHEGDGRALDVNRLRNAEIMYERLTATLLMPRLPSPEEPELVSEREEQIQALAMSVSAAPDGVWCDGCRGVPDNAPCQISYCLDMEPSSSEALDSQSRDSQS